MEATESTRTTRTTRTTGSTGSTGSTDSAETTGATAPGKSGEPEAPADVVIAGHGIVTPFGFGRQPLADAVFAGRSALRPVEHALPDVQGSYVGRLAEPGAWDADRPLRAALRDALAEVEMPAARGARWAVVVPTCATSESMLPPPRQWPADPMAVVADVLPVDFRQYRTSAACSSTSVAVCLARMLLRSDLADVVLIAGAFRLNPYDYTSLSATGSMAALPARPFDTARGGMSLGEGAGAMVLVRARDYAALSAGGAPHARVLGAASLCRSRRPRTVDLEQDTAEECMRRALPAAGAGAIDVVHAHAVGTRQGDQVECAAIADVVGPDVPVSSHKGATGHLLHCSGFVALALACESLARQRVAPTVGTLSPDPELPLSHIPTTVQERAIHTILVNNFGFAGNYASLTLAAS